MEAYESSTRPGLILEVFESFEEAESHERREWLSMPREDCMILLETLRSQSYPDARTHPQGLQRILSVVD